MDQNKIDSDLIVDHYSSVVNSDIDKIYTNKLALSFGYSEQELAAIPEEANMGLGCGNSVSFARPHLKPGVKLLDLGCGAGMDLYLASPLVGDEGRACGVDLSKDMLSKGRELAKNYYVHCCRQWTNTWQGHWPRYRRLRWPCAILFR